MNQKADRFRSFFADVKPILMRDPLAAFLGAFEDADGAIEYSFADVVKMAGHACPTVASSFVCCKKALQALHHGELPERGNIAVTVHADAGDKAYGVMGQVFGFITGAAGETGFKGLGDRYRRQGLLIYDKRAGGPHDGIRFTVARLDNGRKVTADIIPAAFPAVPGQEEMSDLMGAAYDGEASETEARRFRDLWTARIKAMVLDEANVSSWIVVKPA